MTGLNFENGCGCREYGQLYVDLDFDCGFCSGFRGCRDFDFDFDCGCGCGCGCAGCREYVDGSAAAAADSAVAAAAGGLQGNY